MDNIQVTKCCVNTKKNKRCSRNGRPYCIQHRTKYFNKILVLGGLLFKDKLYSDRYLSKLIGNFIYMKDEKRIQNLKTHGKKIFIFGDMLELGNHSEIEHINIAKALNKTGIDVIITFGNKSLFTFLYLFFFHK